MGQRVTDDHGTDHEIETETSVKTHANSVLRVVPESRPCHHQRDAVSEAECPKASDRENDAFFSQDLLVGHGFHDGEVRRRKLGDRVCAWEKMNIRVWFLVVEISVLGKISFFF